MRKTHGNQFLRKAQGLSITTIIVAAIALIVLVVLVAIFTGRIGLFTKGISDVSTCESLGGECLAEPCETERIYGASDCGKDVKSGIPYCCKKP